MKDIVIDGRLDAETAGFGQVVSADPTVSILPLQFLSVSADAQATVNDVIRTEHDSFHTKGIMELTAHFFLKPLADAIQTAFNAPGFRGEEDAFGVNSHARTDVYVIWINPHLPHE